MRKHDDSLIHPLLAGLTLLLSTAVAYLPRFAGSRLFYFLAGTPTIVLSVYAALVLWRSGKLGGLLRPRPGDLTVGALLGGSLLALSWGTRDLLMSQGTTPQTWLYLVYIHLGDPKLVAESFVMTLFLIWVVVAEEIVHRGWVQERLDEYFGQRHGWWLAGTFFGLTLTPTVLTLRAPGLAPNPLLFLAGIGCGLSFSLCRKVTGRLFPGFFAHAVFSYFSVAQFRSPGL